MEGNCGGAEPNVGGRGRKPNLSTRAHSYLVRELAELLTTLTSVGAFTPDRFVPGHQRDQNPTSRPTLSSV